MPGNSSELLLKTKLFTPPIRPGYVHRTRLDTLLSGISQYPLTVVSAPAGYGKTTLLVGWARQSASPVVWFSLDEEDNAPLRFLAYFVRALEATLAGADSSACPAAGEMLSSAQAVPLQFLLTALINDLSEIREPFVIVLDDYQFITSQAVHDIVSFLVERQPPHMHLVIVTRLDPALPLARFRGRGLLLEVRVDDLRFNLEETSAFLNQVMGLDLSREDIDMLESRTEGWIAGLQMAALSLQGRSDRSEFIQAFSGSHRFVLEYLIEEVLINQPEDIQGFLLKTSILDRMCAPLCDYILSASEPWNVNRSTAHPGAPPSGRDLPRLESPNAPIHSSQQILEYLEHANLFVLPLDEEHRWYRYHHLFADLLRARLAQACNSNEIAELHQQAAEWLEGQGVIQEAYDHLLAAQNFEKAADLIENTASDIWTSANVALLSRAYLLPEKLLFARPRLCVAYAWQMIITGRLDAARPLLQAAEAHLLGDAPQRSPQEIPENLRPSLAFLNALKAYLVIFTDQSPPLPEVLYPALSYVPESEVGMRNTLEVMIGLLNHLQGNFEEACRFYESAASRDKRTNNYTAIPIAMARLANLMTVTGQLHAAVKLCQENRAWVERHGIWRFYISGNLKIAQADVLREWNRLEEADQLVLEGIAENQAWRIASALVYGYHVHSQVRLALGDLDGALELVHQIESSLQSLRIHFDIFSVFDARRVKVWLAADRLVEATRWAEAALAMGDLLNDPLDYAYQLKRITLARVWIAQGRLAEAIALLERLNPVEKNAGRYDNLIEILALQARGMHLAGQTRRALDLLRESLYYAGPEGYTRKYLDEGPVMAELFQALARTRLDSQQTSFVQHVQVAFAGEPRRSLPPAQPALVTQELVEPLSEREREVLRLICQGYSNQEISEKLVVTLNTVKKHNTNIFGKLGITNRAQAIVRARQLGLDR